ncbi:MAG: hypothetical protein ACXADB_10230 [Candidatus Hermodarchaeia archaeon]|jgi:hypothetical protein
MSIDYTKLTVAEIKQMILNEGHMIQEQLDELTDVKGKSMWVNLHRNLNHQSTEDTSYEWGELQSDLDNIMDDVDAGLGEPMVASYEPPEEKGPPRPRYDSPEWNDYVMSLFDEGELIDGKYPNVNSLRRLAELLLGEIIFSGPIRVEQTMDPEHTGKAVCTYQITIAWKLDDYYATTDLNVNGDYPSRTFTSVASSWVGNTDDIFAVFPESIAETRAEGRALRRALRLNVVCADELTKKDTAAYVQKQKVAKPTTGEWEEESPITDQQVNTIQLMCDRLGIDVTKFINSGSKNYGDISKVTRTAAAGMLKQLNRYQSTGGDAIEIPQNLIGD